MAVLAFNSLDARSEEAAAATTLAIARAKGPIVIDGMLGDEGWRDASVVDTWYETNPGDNTPPRVKNKAWLAYDDKFFYAAFEFEDPEPGKIKAPLGDHDNTSSATDYAGLIYKLNWQTLLFAGYGDNRELSETDTLERSDRQFFVKLSYAFQH